MNYAELLEYAFANQEDTECPNESRAAFLCDKVFGITTYDEDVSELMGRVMIDVCEAITDRTTFDYIKEPVRYHWFVLMCNMPWLAARINWGTSIRAAFWEYTQCPIDAFWPIADTHPDLRIIFRNKEQFEDFIKAAIAFGRTV